MGRFYRTTTKGARIAAERLRSRLWTLDNYWIRFSIIRRAVLRASLRWNGIIVEERRREKESAVCDSIGTLARLPERRELFKTPEGYGRWIAARLEPSPAFRGWMCRRLTQVLIDGEERYFRPDEIASFEENTKYKTRSGALLFASDQMQRIASLYGCGPDEYLPETYISYAIPDFNAHDFVKKGAPFVLRERVLFSPSETVAVIDFFESRLKIRNPSSPFQICAKFIKDAAVIVAAAFQCALLVFDLAMMVFGAGRNEYYFSLPGMTRRIETRDTPYARRAERIRRMNAAAGFARFASSSSSPAAVNRYIIKDDAQIAVELSYRAYRGLRQQDQNGMTLCAVDWRGISRLASSDSGRFREWMDGVLVKDGWDKVRELLDDLTGGRFGIFRREDVPRTRFCRDLTYRIMKSPAPLSWIERMNRLAGDEIIKVIYYKPNTMKWAGIDEIPKSLIEGIILREDQRFRNDLFPVPHRGNDNLVIIPQIARKLSRIAAAAVRSAAARYRIAWLERITSEFEESLRSSAAEEYRGGSTISNQIMEMLYTKYIPSQSTKASFLERQIEQKEHELPASLAVDWFWTERDLLEAYANEVYGGYHCGDIHGFKSQAEMYFMRSLDRLSLKEQIMLAAAVKKPSRIRDYAQWCKAQELRDLIARAGGAAELAAWENENEALRVTRKNYRQILAEKERAALWMERRISRILHLLRDEGMISEREYRDALRQRVCFRLAPGIVTTDRRLVNNIIREIERELGPGRSDSGLVVVTTIDWPMQKKLQEIIDADCRTIDVESDSLTESQPSSVVLEGGARVICAARGVDSESPVLVNRVLADVGGPSKSDDEWDWVSLANRSLGSSLKPFLDFYYLLLGHGLQDMYRNSPVTYHTYTIEQQRILQDAIHRFPHKVKNIGEIHKYWSWSPRNFTEFTNEWVSVEDALVHSINGIHVQIQEVVTPEAFAMLLNDLLGITDPASQHRPYRSLILGGSDGDQRYDRFLTAYSIFPNRGRLADQTFLYLLRTPYGALLQPRYRPRACPALARFSPARIEAAALLIEMILRETVARGTMHALADIGAGKTGTSNNLRDALATSHFIAGNDVYIAGVRLGNRRNWSIGRAADRLAVPLLRRIVTGLFEPQRIMKGEDFDALLARRAASNPEIIRSKGRYCLRNASCGPRRIDVNEIRGRDRAAFLEKADESFDRGRYVEAAAYYESYLRLASSFDSRHPAFNKMVTSLIETGNPLRAGQIIERFSRPGMAGKIRRSFEKRYGVTLKVDEDFFSGDEEYEKKKKEKRKTSSHKTKKRKEERMK